MPCILILNMSREYRDHNHSVPNSFFFRSVTKFQFETHQEIINHCQANGISPKYSSARVEIHSFSRLSPRWSARYNGEQKMNDMTTCRGGGKFKKKKKSFPYLFSRVPELSGSHAQSRGEVWTSPDPREKRAWLICSKQRAQNPVIFRGLVVFTPARARLSSSLVLLLLRSGADYMVASVRRGPRALRPSSWRTWIT